MKIQNFQKHNSIKFILHFLMLLSFVALLVCFDVYMVFASTKMGQTCDFEIVEKSDTCVSVQYNIEADQTEKDKQKNATITAYVDGEPNWTITLVPSDAYHTMVAVLKNLEPDTTYNLTMQLKYSDGSLAPMSESFEFSTLPDQSKVIGRNIAFGKETVSDSDISAVYASNLVTNGYTGKTGYGAYDVWSSKNDGDHWVYIDLEKEMYFNKVNIKFYGASGSTSNPYAKAFKIEGSNDKQNWYEIKKVENNTQNITELELDKTHRYRYVRVYLVTPYTNDKRLRISEIEIYSAIGVESISPYDIGVAMGVNQNIDAYSPTVYLNDGNVVDISTGILALESDNTGVLEITGSKLTAKKTGTANLKMTFEYDGYTVSNVQEISVSDFMIESFLVENNNGNLVGKTRIKNFDVDKDALLVLATYNENGYMTGISSSEFGKSIKKDENSDFVTLTTKSLPDEKISKFKLFLIDGIKTKKVYFSKNESGEY